MLVSPIMMVPMFRTPKQLQEDYLHHFNDMSLRKGVCVCVCVCVRARARVPVCVCVCKKSQKRLLFSGI